MIDSHEASEALADIDEHAPPCPAVADLRSRQPDDDHVGRARFRRLYHYLFDAEPRFCRLGHGLWHRHHRLAALSSINRPRSGVRTFGPKFFIAFALFVAFGGFCCVLGQFGPRQISAFWPVYFLMMYSIAGLWFGLRLHRHSALPSSALTLIGYFYLGSAFDLWMGFQQWRRPCPRRSVDAAGLAMAELDDIIHQPLRCESWRR